MTDRMVIIGEDFSEPEPIPYLTDEQRAKEHARAAKDSELIGVGYLVDGRHVAPQRVSVVRQAHWPHVTTAELYGALRGVLAAKGAADAWIEYAIHDLHVAAIQYAGDQWARGWQAHADGDPLPNPEAQPLGGQSFIPEPRTAAELTTVIRTWLAADCDWGDWEKRLDALTRDDPEDRDETSDAAALREIKANHLWDAEHPHSHDQIQRDAGLAAQDDQL